MGAQLVNRKLPDGVPLLSSALCVCSNSKRFRPESNLSSPLWYGLKATTPLRLTVTHLDMRCPIRPGDEDVSQELGLEVRLLVDPQRVPEEQDKGQGRPLPDEGPEAQVEGGRGRQRTQAVAGLGVVLGGGGGQVGEDGEEVEVVQGRRGVEGQDRLEEVDRRVPDVQLVEGLVLPPGSESRPARRRLQSAFR